MQKFHLIDMLDYGLISMRFQHLVVTPHICHNNQISCPQIEVVKKMTNMRYAGCLFQSRRISIETIETDGMIKIGTRSEGCYHRLTSSKYLVLDRARDISIMVRAGYKGITKHPDYKYYDK